MELGIQSKRRVIEPRGVCLVKWAINRKVISLNRFRAPQRGYLLSIGRLYWSDGQDKPVGLRDSVIAEVL